MPKCHFIGFSTLLGYIGLTLTLHERYGLILAESNGQLEGDKCPSTSEMKMITRRFPG